MRFSNVVFRQAIRGQIPVKARRASPKGVFTLLKKGGPTVIFTPRTASEIIGNRVPQSVAKVMPTRIRLL